MTRRYINYAKSSDLRRLWLRCQLIDECGINCGFILPILLDPDLYFSIMIDIHDLAHGRIKVTAGLFQQLFITDSLKKYMRKYTTRLSGKANRHMTQFLHE